MGMSVEENEKQIENKYLKFFRGLYHRNKNLLIISLSIYFISLVAGILLALFASSPVNNFIDNLVKTDRQFLSQNGFTTISIFSHNIVSLIITFIGGITGIITVGLLFINGFIYGSFLGYVTSNPTFGGQASSIGSLSPAKFIIYTLPHGIFEISGFIIAGAAGLRLTSIIINLIKRDEDLTYYKNDLKDSVSLFAIAAVLTFIAAIIETNLSISIGNYIFQYL